MSCDNRRSNSALQLTRPSFTLGASQLNARPLCGPKLLRCAWRGNQKGTSNRNDVTASSRARCQNPFDRWRNPSFGDIVTPGGAQPDRGGRLALDAGRGILRWS